jgi:aconitate hydratase
MVRGTFANVRLRNLLAAGAEGSVTAHLPDGEQASIYEASLRYQAEGVPLIVIAGKEYGSGSSRDWAAKGPTLLGVRAVIAESFERIHRSNLLMMGILPLQFTEGESPASLGLTGRETFDVEGFADAEARIVRVTATQDSLPATHPTTGPTPEPVRFAARVRLDTPREREYLRHGGILRFVLRRLRAT